MSLQADALVAWCGDAGSRTELFVFDRPKDDFELFLRVDGDTAVLTMENSAGTFTWQRT